MFRWPVRLWRDLFLFLVTMTYPHIQYAKRQKNDKRRLQRNRKIGERRIGVGREWLLLASFVVPKRLHEVGWKKCFSTFYFPGHLRVVWLRLVTFISSDISRWQAFFSPRRALRVSSKRLVFDSYEGIGCPYLPIICQPSLSRKARSNNPVSTASEHSYFAPSLQPSHSTLFWIWIHDATV